MGQVFLKTNRVLMAEARDFLSGRWTLALGVNFLFILILTILEVIPGIGCLIAFVLTGPLTIGVIRIFLAIAQKQEAKATDLFSESTAFDPIWRGVKAYFFMMLYILLWSLLLIIPGIMAAFSYALTFWLMAEDPNLSGREALIKSKALMFGKRWKLACLYLRFTGWFVLSILTLGIGFLWLMPYVATSKARFYLDIKASATNH